MNFCNFNLYSKAKQQILFRATAFVILKKKLPYSTYPSMMCIFVVGIDETVPLLPEREPVRGKENSTKSFSRRLDLP